MPTYVLTSSQLNNRILNSFSIPAGSSFDPDAQAFITAAGITDPTQQTAIDSLVIGLKADSLWTNMQAIYPFVGGTATTHKYNLKDPRDLNAAYRLSFAGGWTHSVNGALGNGVNNICDTNYVGLQTGEIGAYNNSTNAVSQLFLGAEYAANWLGEDYPIYYTPRIKSFVYSYGAETFFSNSDNTNGEETENSMILNSATNPNIGFWTLSGGSPMKTYSNGVLKNIRIPSLPTTACPISIWLGGVNYGFNLASPSDFVYGNARLAFGFITTTVLNQTQNTNLYTRVQAFQTALSRQV